MYGYIYKFTNLINDKVYVGKHKYDKPRLDERYLTSGTLIKQSIDKHGLNNFSHELICCCDSLEELNEKEIFYIKYFDCKVPNGYNMTNGGDGISEPSKDIIEKNRQWHLGKKQSEETIRKKSESLKKVVHTEEWIKKISEANKGQFVSEYQRQISSKVHKGTHWYNDGANEYMLFDDDERIKSLNLTKGRLNNPFPNQTGVSKPKEQVEKTRLALLNSYWVNDGKQEIMIHDKNLPEGFVKGRLKRNLMK